MGKKSIVCGAGGDGGGALTRRGTPKPTGETGEGGEATGWAPALHTRRTAYIVYIVCVRVPRAVRSLGAASEGVSPSPRPACPRPSAEPELAKRVRIKNLSPTSGKLQAKTPCNPDGAVIKQRRMGQKSRLSPSGCRTSSRYGYAMWLLSRYIAARRLSCTFAAADITPLSQLPLYPCPLHLSVPRSSRSVLESRQRGAAQIDKACGGVGAIGQGG